MADIKPTRSVINMVEKCGYDLSYTYQNLLFVDTSDFILQVGEEDPNVILFFGNNDPEEDTDQIFEALHKHATEEIDLVNAGSFGIEEADVDQKVQIRFYPIETSQDDTQE